MLSMLTILIEEVTLLNIYINNRYVPNGSTLLLGQNTGERGRRLSCKTFSNLVSTLIRPSTGLSLKLDILSIVQ